jgi:RNA polymerase sigma-70 factor (ECF subfamily)
MRAEVDQILWEKWRKGDVQAFGELFERHAPRLYNLAYRLSGSQEEARDLLQSAALRAFSSNSSCRNGAAFHSWIRRIVTNLYFDQRKFKTRAGRDSLDEKADWSEIESTYSSNQDLSPRETLEQRESIKQVESALAKLDPIYRSSVVLCDIEGLSYSEIAELEGIPVETVRTRLRRGRQALRKELGSLSGAL